MYDVNRLGKVQAGIESGTVAEMDLLAAWHRINLHKLKHQEARNGLLESTSSRAALGTIPPVKRRKTG